MFYLLHKDIGGRFLQPIYYIWDSETYEMIKLKHKELMRQMNKGLELGNVSADFLDARKKEKILFVREPERYNNMPRGMSGLTSKTVALDSSSIFNSILRGSKDTDEFKIFIDKSDNDWFNRILLLKDGLFYDIKTSVNSKYLANKGDVIINDYVYATFESTFVPVYIRKSGELAIKHIGTRFCATGIYFNTDGSVSTYFNFCKSERSNVGVRMSEGEYSKTVRNMKRKLIFG